MQLEESKPRVQLKVRVLPEIKEKIQELAKEPGMKSGSNVTEQLLQHSLSNLNGECVNINPELQPRLKQFSKKYKSTPDQFVNMVLAQAISQLSDS